ncbi:BglG family transcription antiterminator LicT [Clostridium hydrogeniformans]|uniref:BglG family transcription antiterminator LicT n=1 Tax=Clostridium hydrogeniformans TaxID=349933 RepID=UPI00047F5757|nr:PRD domain-containing protein [Clostridium hydrogeniformans]
MNIEKILNNNVVVSLDDKGKEVIVMGRGIAFQKKVGMIVEKDKVEKIFTLSNKELSDKYKQLLLEVPVEYVILTEKIISYAKLKLGKKLNESIHISLADHIASAVERYKEGIQLRNPLLWDIKRIYKDEFSIGKESINMINNDLNVELSEDEAAFIALHIVNAELNEEMPKVMDMTKVMQEILNIVKYHFKIDFNEESLSYYRFITHLKFFAQRLFNGNAYKDKEDELFEMIKRKYLKSYECVKKIDKFIKEKYKYELTKEEKLYLTIHIERVTESNI